MAGWTLVFWEPIIPVRRATSTSHGDEGDCLTDKTARTELDKGNTQNRSRGIFLVANRNSSEHCHNLIFSIRECGCGLPIRVLPYGGEPLVLEGGLADVRVLTESDFPAEGQAFVGELRRRMPMCSPGLLARFLAWFGEFDEFLYSDNDIVAMMNWEDLFAFLADDELVNADWEYRTGGIFNLQQPARFEELMGGGALEQAVTAGHFLCRREAHQISDLLAALAWMEAHPEVPKWHDQALLLVAVVLGKWKALNLCKPPHGWASSWAGDYRNLFDVVRTIQAKRQPLSHLHYSGGAPTGAGPVEELLFANLPTQERNRKLLGALAMESTGVGRVKRKVRREWKKVVKTLGSK